MKDLPKNPVENLQHQLDIRMPQKADKYEELESGSKMLFLLTAAVVTILFSLNTIGDWFVLFN